MEQVEIEAEKRTSKGSPAARRYRRQGKVPAILYGQGDPLSINVDGRALGKLINTGGAANAVWTLKIDGHGDEPAIIRDIQRNPVTRALNHIDFLRIVLTEKITTTVPVELVGESPAVKLGGNLLRLMRQLEVRALPLQIPSSIKIDMTKLENVGDSVHVSDITFTDDVEIITAPEITILAVQAPRVEEVETPAEGEEAAAAQPEVVGKEKDAADGEKEEK